MRDNLIDITVYYPTEDTITRNVWVNFERYNGTAAFPSLARHDRSYRNPTRTSMRRLSRWLNDRHPKLHFAEYSDPFGWTSFRVERTVEPCSKCGSFEGPDDKGYCQNCWRPTFQ